MQALAELTLLVLATVAVGGMGTIVALVARANRESPQPRSPATVTPIGRRLGATA